MPLSHFLDVFQTLDPLRLQEAGAFGVP